MNSIARFLRASGVGILASLVDLAVLTLLVHGLGLSAQLANVPALLCGAAIQFVGARKIVFAKSNGAFSSQLAGFAIAELGTLVLNALGFALLIHFAPIPVALARVVSTLGVFALYSFPAWTLAFRAAESRA